MATQDFKLTFGVDIKELVTGMTEATEAVTEAAATMKEALASVAETFGKIGEASIALGAILAGGSAFKEFVETSVDLTKESVALGRQLGISATEASILKVAMNSVFVTQEDFAGGAARLTRTLAKNPDAFRDLGVAIRDSNGELRTTPEIMADVNAKLLQFTEGTARNIEGTKIYGRGWQEVSGILKLTPSVIEEAKDKAEELGLVVGVESVAQTKAYRSALQELHEVFEASFKVVGDAVIPSLTKLAQFLGEQGPATVNVFRIAMDAFGSVFDSVTQSVKALWEFITEAVGSFRAAINDMFGTEPLSLLELFKNSLKVIEVAFIALRVGVQVTAAFIGNELEYLKDLVDSWAAVIEAAFHLDWAGVRAAWKAGNDRIEADEEAHFQKLVDISAKGAKDMNDAIFAEMGKKAPVTEIEPPKQGKDAEEGPAKDILKKYELELELAKLSYEKQSEAQGGFQQFSLEQELQFWQAKLALHQTSGDKTLEIDKKIAGLQLQVNKQAYEAQLAALKQQEAEAGKSAAAKIAIAEKEVELVGRAYQNIGPEYAAAQKHLIEVQQQANDQLRQMADSFSKLEDDRRLKALDEDQKILEEKFKDHEINADQLARAEIQLEDQRTAIARKGIEERLSLIDPTHDPVQYAQLTAQLEGLELQYQDKITQIQKQAEQNRRALFNEEFKTLENGFSTAIANMVKGTQTFQQAMQTMLRTILDSIIKMLAEWVVQWAATQVKNLLSSKVSAAQGVEAQAGVAGASGVASFSQAPWPFDLGAPSFGAAMFNAAMGYEAAATAQEGYDIPSGVYPRTDLHPREMVLPADLADGIRAMVAAGNARGGSSTAVQINATDSRSFERMLMRNPAAMQKSIQMLASRARR